MRTFNSIKSTFWRKLPKNLPANARYLLIYILTNDGANVTGFQAFSPERITADLNISGDIIHDAFMELRKAGLILFEDGYIWTPLRWTNEQTRSGKVLELVKSEMECMPEGIRKAFQVTLDTLSDTVSDTVFVSLPGETETETETETKDLPPPNGDAGKTPLVLSSAPKAKKKRPSIEQSTPRTDVGKLLKLWHVTYRSVHGSGYSGDYRKMCGQAAELLTDNCLADLIAGAVYLLRGKKHGQYNPHTFDHFVTRASNYIIEAKEEGYVYDPGTDSD